MGSLGRKSSSRDLAEAKAGKVSQYMFVKGYSIVLMFIIKIVIFSVCILHRAKATTVENNKQEL